MFAAQLQGLTSGSSCTTRESSFGHHFIQIPWCNQHLTWEVLPSQANIAAPDFVFDDTSFQPLSSQQKGSHTASIRTCLLSWSRSDPGLLLQLVQLLLQAFTQHHLKLMTNLLNARLQFELDTLPPTEGLELMLFQLPEDPSVNIVVFRGYISSETVAEGGGGEKAAQAQQCHPNLVLHVPVVLLQQLRGMTPPLSLPGWGSHMCLAEFLPLASEQLQRQLDTFSATLATKQQARLEEHLDRILGSPTECNGPSSLFTVTHSKELFTIFVQITARFPEEAPTIQLQHAATRPSQLLDFSNTPPTTGNSSTSKPGNCSTSNAHTGFGNGPGNSTSASPGLNAGSGGGGGGMDSDTKDTRQRWRWRLGLAGQETGGEWCWQESESKSESKPGSGTGSGGGSSNAQSAPSGLFQTCVGCPWSPRWSGEVMAQRMIDFMSGEITRMLSQS
ncbi:MAG: hypothetical protein WDW38_007943 [Sanguina aurantia]